MATLTEYQDCQAHCPNLDCKRATSRTTVPYRLSRTVPWMLESDTAICSECGEVFSLRLEPLPSGAVRVHVEIVPTP